MREEHKALGFMLMTPAWEGLYKARIAEKVKEHYSLLLDPSAARRGVLPDDYIRGFIAALKWAVEWPDQEMNAAAEAEADEEAIAAAQHNITPLFGGNGAIDGNS